MRIIRFLKALIKYIFIGNRVDHTVHNTRLEICSNCHPFYTGEQKLVDTAGRVERFRKRYDKKDTTKAEAPKAEAPKAEAPEAEAPEA